MPGCFKMTHFPLPFQPAAVFTLYIQVLFLHSQHSLGRGDSRGIQFLRGRIRVNLAKCVSLAFLLSRPLDGSTLELVPKAFP